MGEYQSRDHPNMLRVWVCLFVIFVATESRDHKEDLVTSPDEPDPMTSVQPNEMSESQTIPVDEIEDDQLPPEDISVPTPMPHEELNDKGCCYEHPFPHGDTEPTGHEPDPSPLYPTVHEISPSIEPETDLEGDESESTTPSLTSTASESPSITPSVSTTPSATPSPSLSESATASPSPSVTPTSHPDETSCVAIQEEIHALTNTSVVDSWVGTFGHAVPFIPSCDISDSLTYVCESSLAMLKAQPQITVKIAGDLKKVYESSFIIGTTSFSLHLCLANLGVVVVGKVKAQRQQQSDVGTNALVEIGEGPLDTQMEMFVEAIRAYAVIMIQKMKLIPTIDDQKPANYTDAVIRINNINQQISDVVDLIGILSNQDFGESKKLTPVARLHQAMLKLLAKCVIVENNSTSSGAETIKPVPYWSPAPATEDTKVSSDVIPADQHADYFFDERPTRWRVCGSFGGMVMLITVSVLTMLAVLSPSAK